MGRDYGECAVHSEAAWPSGFPRLSTVIGLTVGALLVGALAWWGLTTTGGDEPEVSLSMTSPCLDKPAGHTMSTP